jgi:hypothetical protein
MLVTMSERASVQLIRELENIESDVTIEEITERMVFYSERLFRQKPSMVSGLTVDAGFVGRWRIFPLT